MTSSSAKREPLIGFGDPYFSTQQADEDLAQGKRGPLLEVAALPDRDVAVRRRAAVETRKIDSADLARLPRLPDTADELKSIALSLKADPSRALYLGKAANEAKVKGIDLTKFRIVAFATHGLMPGDLNGLTQPALALTAPNVADVDGDGLLTMEEVLALKLDADWVVLSACNTATGAAAGAEAISGLGRAFFYAGARALLVTNWAVMSDAATALVADLFRRQAADPGLGRAEALRQAMLGLIDGPGYIYGGKTFYSYAHPLFWAPYTIIGDGSSQ
jgi:CHAT domain-containing protein